MQKWMVVGSIQVMYIVKRMRGKEVLILMVVIGQKVLILEGPFEGYFAVVKEKREPLINEYQYVLRVTEYPDDTPVPDDNESEWTYECDDHEFDENEVD